jgi:LuxR family maltose regulon positive regulatory protein
MLGTLSLARVKAARRDTGSASELLERAAQLAATTRVPRMISLVDAFRARLCLASDGRNAEVATRWTRAYGLTTEDQADYYHEVEYLTLARLAIAQARGQADPAGLASLHGLLARLLLAAETAGRTGSTIEILMLSAIGWQVQDETARAMIALGRALSLAEPEGYVRTFADEGAPMAELLQEAARRQILPDYGNRVLALLGGSAQPGQPLARMLAEPLTTRELQVLRLLAAGLSSREIAAELVVTVSTAKAHARHIFEKLDVHNRTQAAALARELHLV